MQGVNGYSSVVKRTNICSDEEYDSQVSKLSGGLSMMAVKKLCENFESSTCITSGVSDMWNQVTGSVSNGFGEAVTSLQNFMKNIGQQFNSQNISDTFKQSASNLQNTFATQTQELRNMLGNIGNSAKSSVSNLNRYSMVDDSETAASSNSFSLKNFFSSLIPTTVDVIEKRSPSESQNQNSFLDIFKQKNSKVRSDNANPYTL